MKLSRSRFESLFSCLVSHVAGCLSAFGLLYQGTEAYKRRKCNSHGLRGLSKIQTPVYAASGEDPLPGVWTAAFAVPARGRRG